MATIREVVGSYIIGVTDVEENTVQYPGLQKGMLGEVVIFSDKLTMLPGVTEIQEVVVGDTFYDVVIEVQNPRGYCLINVHVGDPEELQEVARELSITLSTETRLHFEACLLAWWKDGVEFKPLRPLTEFYVDVDPKWTDYTRVLFT